jgi:hypothetical protein
MLNRIASSATFFIAIISAACVPPQAKQAPQPLGPPRYDYAPPPPCATAGASKLTIAVISPQWPSSTQPSSAVSQQGRSLGNPRVLLEMAPAMQQDFLELMTCRGYLTKGPFDSFEAMVYPDREGSNLLLEPELQISASVGSVRLDAKGLLFGTPMEPSPTSSYPAVGEGSVGGRVTLTLKEPVTNTRMWTRSIEVPAEAFSFTTEQKYPGSETAGRLRVLVLSDQALRRELQPRLETMYQNVLRTAENYLNRTELESVARQATDVRKKAAISVPK